MWVYGKKKVRINASSECFDLGEASMSCFHFNLHPDSKFTRRWLSEEEGGRCWIVHKEENRSMGRGSLQLGEPQMMDVPFSYAMLWELMSSVPVGGRRKRRLVGFLLSLAHSLLELSRDGCHKLWIITLRLDVYQNCILEKKDMEYYKKRWAAELEEECCCSICLDDMVKGSTVTRLPCSHVFHGDCIFKWLRRGSYTCPLCRFQVPLIPP